MIPFWQFLTAHVVGDFVFQSERMVAGKRDGSWGAFLAHGGVHLATLAVITWPFLSGRLVLAWGVVVAAHLVLDGLKEAAGRQFRSLAGAVWLFLVDQIVHVVIVLQVLLWLGPFPADGPLLWTVLGTEGARLWAPWLLSSRTWQVAAIYGYTLAAAAILIRLVLQAAGLEGGRPSQAGITRAGTWIGILERGLILSLLLVRAEAAVGFVLAAKSIARFKELEERAFAEYYLVGTLLSAGIALLGFLALR
ncbi:DUF3307 domain-containing protein [Limnochorda pilosa]|uniref:DUF3307 domain-containing protein n=1 Tax=Limnochorda pilosa TaxID=1555112 RepID=A0A0K2SQB3_LIMPI|nr:DUF3307 domain-containing protein [Limnochorda pilosa]BAS29318.1 hypothetical protein LIP_3506 [Limnochorda pilosa]